MSTLKWGVNQGTSTNDLFQTRKWYECDDGYTIGGFYRSECQSIFCLESMQCVAPYIQHHLLQGPQIMQFEEGSCKEMDFTASFDSAGTIECDENYFVKGIFGGAGARINSGLGYIEKLKCCRYDDQYLLAGPSEYHDWLLDFDVGRENRWNLVDNTQFLTGLHRAGGEWDEPIHALDKARVRKLYQSM